VRPTCVQIMRVKMIYGFKTESELNGKGFIKIGLTGNIRKRFMHIQTGCPVPLELIFYRNGDKETEKAFHENLSDFRVFGEWFKDCKEVRDYLGYVHSPSNKTMDHGKAPLRLLRFFLSHSANAYEVSDFAKAIRISERELLHKAVTSKVFLVQNWSWATCNDQKDYCGGEFEGKRLIIMARENPHELKTASHDPYQPT
jgi:hypothetical protein